MNSLDVILSLIWFNGDCKVKMENDRGARKIFLTVEKTYGNGGFLTVEIKKPYDEDEGIKLQNQIADFLDEK